MWVYTRVQCALVLLNAAEGGRGVSIYGTSKSCCSEIR